MLLLISLPRSLGTISILAFSKGLSNSLPSKYRSKKIAKAEHSECGWFPIDMLKSETSLE